MSEPDIPITGWSANDPDPMTALEIAFAQGAAASGVGELRVLLVANMLSSGTATADTVVQGPGTAIECVTETDVNTLFGARSEMAQVWRRFTSKFKGINLFCLGVTESVGAKSTLDVTFTTAATGNATCRTWVNDDYVDSPITSGDSVTTIAAAQQTAVATKTGWPVTSSPTAGVNTFTSAQKGLRANQIKIRCQIFPSCGTTVDRTAATNMANGTTADVWTTALATMLAQKFQYIVVACTDATTIGLVNTQVNTQAGPLVGMLQRVFAGSQGTPSATVTIAATPNSARTEIACLEEIDVPGAEVAAGWAATIIEREASNPPELSHIGVDLPFKAPSSGNVPTHTERVTMLNGGVSPIGVRPDGSTQIVDRITTKSTTGGVADYRIRDSHKVTVCDFFGESLKAKVAVQYAQCTIGSDQIQGQPPPGPKVLTENRLKACVTSVIDEYTVNGLIDPADAVTIKSNTKCKRSANPTTRISARIPLKPIDIVKQIGLRVEQN